MKGSVLLFNNYNGMGQIESGSKIYNFSIKDVNTNSKIVVNGTMVEFKIVQDEFSTRVVAKNIEILKERIGQITCL